MKRIILTILLSFAVSANAALNLIGQGTSTHGAYNLIYDTDLDITWYDYSNYVVGWQNQMDWADGLSVTFGSNTYTDWRLPNADPTCGVGYNCTGSELGHLYYTELENLGYPTPGYGLSNTGDFQNLSYSTYWSGTKYAANPGYVWSFGNYYGTQTYYGNDRNLEAMAVRPGLAVTTSVVPEPISSILFLTGGATLGFRRFWKKRSAT